MVCEWQQQGSFRLDVQGLDFPLFKLMSSSCVQENSIYNEICNVEWAVEPGEVKACGGDVMMSTKALEQFNGV